MADVAKLSCLALWSTLVGAPGRWRTMPLPGGLFQASKGRALAENTRPSRARGGRVRRTLDATALADWVDRLCQIDGDERLAGCRDRAEQVAEVVGAPEDGTSRVAQLIGAALGTRQVDTISTALAARQARLPYDHDRMALFGRLVDALRRSAPQNRPVHDLRDARYAFLPFFEAYFSNFIEGTEFELADAVAIVYEHKQVAGRADDSHDLIGTYQVVSDDGQMPERATAPGEFVQILRARHATILAGRPDRRPGQFKQAPNRAGSSSFVLPGYVAGTPAVSPE